MPAATWRRRRGLCERPFGAVVASASSSGKSSVLEAICALVPEEDLVNLSAITPQALYYLAAGALRHKVLVLAEEQGTSRASYALKLLLSEGRLSIAATGKERASGRLQTRSYEVAGPVSVLMTSTDAELDPELENRLVTLSTNESPEQTAAIQRAQLEAMSLDALVARRQREKIVGLHRNAQRLLAPFPVVLPPGAMLDLPSSLLRHRRDHQKALSMIAAITILHQHQREQRSAGSGENTITYLEASAEDVERGVTLARGAVLPRRRAGTCRGAPSRGDDGSRRRDGRAQRLPSRRGRRDAARASRAARLVRQAGTLRHRAPGATRAPGEHACRARAAAPLPPRRVLRRQRTGALLAA